jgi:hypothetical protein
VVELKYRPQRGADWEKDLETLQWIAVNHVDLRVANQRFRGPAAAVARDLGIWLVNSIFKTLP